MHRRIAVTLAVAAIVSLAGCGKAGRPLQPPDSTFPQIYPSPSSGPMAAQQKEGRALPPEWDQQDLKDRFTPNGSYIDPSTKVIQTNQIVPGSNLPNSFQSQGNTPFDKGLGAPSQSPLQPVQPSPPPGEDEQQ
jgi:predicted small lipoprotein YifL